MDGVWRTKLKRNLMIYCKQRKEEPRKTSKLLHMERERKDLSCPRGCLSRTVSRYPPPLTPPHPIKKRELRPHIVCTDTSSDIHTKRTRQWIRAKGSISPAGSHQAHLSALAYMSDSYFIGTVSRVHNLWRFGSPKKRQSNSDSSQNTGGKEDSPKPHPLAKFEEAENGDSSDRPVIGMMVSLDHTIYFHRPRDVRVDEWIYTVCEGSFLALLFDPNNHFP